MEPLHSKLGQKHRWYANWHKYPRHHHCHWAVFVALSFLVSNFLISQIYLFGVPSTANAASYQVEVGPLETVLSYTARHTVGRGYWPDGTLGVINSGSSYTFFGADGGKSNSNIVKTVGNLNNPITSSANTIPVQSLKSNYDYYTGGPVYKDPATDTLLLFVHTERWPGGDGFKFWSTIALAKSTDNGNTWSDLGEIISPHAGIETNTSSGSDIGGGSYLIIGDYIYVYFNDKLDNANANPIAVARARLSGVLNAAINQNTVVSWNKYYNGGWSEPGLRGLSSSLEQPITTNMNWYSTSYNEYLGKYIMVGSSDWPNANLYLFDSADGVNWAKRQQLESDPGESVYVTIVGTGSNPSVTSDQFYVYYIYSLAGGWNRFDDAILARRLVTLSPPPPPSQNPLGFWKLDEGSGTTAINQINGGGSGTLINGPTWTTGKLGQALSFDGIDDQVRITDQNLANMPSFSLSAWVNARSWGGNNTGGGRIIGKSDNISLARFALGMSTKDNSSIVFNAGYATNGGQWKTAVGSFSLNSWHHVIVIYTHENTSSTPSIYIDGIPQSTTQTSIPSGSAVNDDNNLYIGSRGINNARVFDGVIDQVRVYNRELSALEVSTLYAEGNPVPAPTVSLSVSPTTITAGQSSTLTWFSTNATSCTASDAWSGSKATSGTESVSPTATSTYTLSCTGSGGTTSQFTIVTVNAALVAPTISSFTANPSTITTGQSSTLSWSVSNATSLFINQGIGIVTGTTKSVSPTTTTTYTLTATNTSGSVTANTTITVNPPANQLPTGNFDGLEPDGVTLYGWSYDPDSPTSSISIQVFVDGPMGVGTLIATTTTNILRSDVNTYFALAPNSAGNQVDHGFEVLIPTSLRDNKPYSYYTYGIDFNDSTKSTHLTGSPKTFTIAPPADTTPPSIPTNLKATVVSSTQIDLTWTASTDNVGVVGYKIYRNNSQVNLTDVNSHSDINLTPATTYTYTISAFDSAANNSTKSASVSATTENPPVPAPTISSFTANPTSITSGNSSVLSWSVSNATSLSINQGIGTVTGTSRSVSPTNTTTYTLTATNSAGQVTATTMVTVNPAVNQLPIGNFDGLKADGVTLYGWSYDPDSPSSSITIQVYADGPMGSGTLISTTTTNALRADVNSAFAPLAASQTDHGFEVLVPTNLRDNNPHSYYVYGIDFNDSSKSTQLTGSPKTFTIAPPADTTPPSTPTNLVAIVISSTQINLTWTVSTDNIGVAGYKIYRNGAQVNLATSTSHLDKNLTPATTYTYTISAYDAAANNSAQSTSVQATTQVAPPPPPPPPPPGPTPTPTPTPSPSPSPSPSPNPVPPPPPTLPDDGRLIKDASSPAIYVMEYGKKRPFATWAAFIGFGYKPANVQVINTANIPSGEAILTANQRHIRGTLVVSSGTVYYLGAQLKYPFPSAEVFLSWNNRFQDVVPTNSYDTQMLTGPIVQKKP